MRRDDLRRDPTEVPVGLQRARRQQVRVPLPARRELRGPGGAPGARHHGAGAAGERAGRVAPGRHALSAGLLPRQVRWSVRHVGL